MLLEYMHKYSTCYTVSVYFVFHVIFLKCDVTTLLSHSVKRVASKMLPEIDPNRKRKLRTQDKVLVGI